METKKSYSAETLNMIAEALRSASEGDLERDMKIMDELVSRNPDLANYVREATKAMAEAMAQAMRSGDFEPPKADEEPQEKIIHRGALQQDGKDKGSVEIFTVDGVEGYFSRVSGLPGMDNPSVSGPHQTDVIAGAAVANLAEGYYLAIKNGARPGGRKAWLTRDDEHSPFELWSSEPVWDSGCWSTPEGGYSAEITAYDFQSNFPELSMVGGRDSIVELTIY